MGRTPEAGVARTEVVQVRATKEELESWREAAEKSKMPLSKWMRRKLSRGLRRAK